MKYPLLLSAAVVCGAFSSVSFADSSANYMKGIVGFGLNFGGDTIREYRVEYDDGDKGTEDVKAGEGIHFFGGMELGYPASDLALRLQLGYIMGGIFADNGEVRFDRVPIEGIMFLGDDSLKFGLGLTYHTNVELSDDVYDDVAFKNSLGFVAQGEYWFSDIFGLGLRVTKIDYQPKGVKGIEFDGTGAGIYGTFAF